MISKFIGNREIIKKQNNVQQVEKVIIVRALDFRALIVNRMIIVPGPRGIEDEKRLEEYSDLNRWRWSEIGQIVLLPVVCLPVSGNADNILRFFVSFL